MTNWKYVLKKINAATHDDHSGQRTLSRKMNCNEEQTSLSIFLRMRNNWLDSTKGSMGPPSASQIHQPSQAVVGRANIRLGGEHQRYLLSGHLAQVNCHKWTAVISISRYLIQHIKSLGTQKRSFSSVPNKHVHLKGQALISSLKT